MGGQAVCLYARGDEESGSVAVTVGENTSQGRRTWASGVQGHTWVGS